MPYRRMSIQECVGEQTMVTKRSYLVLMIVGLALIELSGCTDGTQDDLTYSAQDEMLTQNLPVINRSPAWSPDNRQIAFVSTRDGNDEIYAMAADGSSPRRLTNNSAHDGSPVWSPDGSQIAFESWRDRNQEIYVMAADGSNLRNLTDNSAMDWWPVWSPDGSQIALLSWRDGNQEIYLMAADGSSPHKLTNNRAIDDRPVWSPDGSQIAFESERDGNQEIYVMAADGSHPRNLTNNRAIDDRPVWSPDGSQIAFVSRRDGNNEIYVMAADGSHPRNLTNNSAVDNVPIWTSDGSQIVFESERDGNREIYVMDVDGGNPRNLTQRSDDDWGPVWSPDGSQIAFLSWRDDDWGIYVMAADGSLPRTLAETSATAESLASPAPLTPEPPVGSTRAPVSSSGPYDETAVAQKDIEIALANAQEDGKLVLLDFGANWCPDCVVLSTLLEDPSVQPYLQDNFYVVKIDVGNWDKNLDISQQYGDPIENGIPAVVVLASDGELMATTRDGALANARTATAQEILGYLERWVAQKP